MLLPLLMNLEMFTPPTAGVSYGGKKRKKDVIRLSELTDGDRRTTSDFIKAHIAMTPERAPFTRYPTTPKSEVMTDMKKNDIIAIILAGIS